MTKIFWGFIFTFFDFFISVEMVTIQFIPDFVGYILIYMGLTEFKQWSNHFEQGRIFAIILSVITGIDFVLNLLGINAAIAMVSTLAVMASHIISIFVLGFDIYVTYCIIAGIADMEYNEQQNYNSDKLKSLWIANVALNVAAVIVGYLGYFAVGDWVDVYSTLAILEAGIVIAAVVVNIIFLVRFNDTRKRIEYENNEG